MYSISTVLNNLCQVLELPTDQPGLGLPVILGFPDTGRTTPTYPIGAITFDEDDFRSDGRKVRTIGRVEAQGSTITVVLFLIHESEAGLLELVDRLRVLRNVVSGLVADDTKFVMKYGPTKRSPQDPEHPNLAYVTETMLTLNTI